ncbi:MAG: head GIN domain-containing protein [Bacillota bacterium]
MKKRIVRMALTILVPVCIVLAITGCKDGVIGNGQAVTKEIQISDALTGVINTGSFEVTIDPSLKGKAVLEGESNILDLVEAGQNADGVFEIAFKPAAILSLRTVKARIPAVNGGIFRIDGTGSIRLDGDNALKGDIFDLQINGTGSMKLNLNATQLRAVISGTGNVDVTGEAGKSEIEINGTGNFNGLDCKAASANVRISGSGNAYVNTSGALTCSIFGSGNVVYKGNPAKISADGGGSGKVNKY